MDFLRLHQLNIMLVLMGICGILAFCVLLTKTLNQKRKNALFSLEISSMLLLYFDRYAYIFRGNTSDIGFWLVRICNFFVFFFSITILYAFNSYLIDLYRSEGGGKKCPFRLRLCKIVAVLSITILIISQFTNFYYYFDESNHYVRGRGIIVSYIGPLIMLVLDLSLIIDFFDRFRRLISIPLIIFAVFPFIASIIQIFAYGISFTNISMVGLAILLYIFCLIDLNETVEKAKRREIEILKDEQSNI